MFRLRRRANGKGLAAFLLFGLTIVVPGKAQDHNTDEFELKIGYTYLGRPRHTGFTTTKQTTPAKLKFWLLPNLYIYSQSDIVKSTKSDTTARNTSVADSKYGIDYRVFAESKYWNQKSPEFDLDYEIKVPTAKAGLGSGETDHQIMGSLIKGLGNRTSLELDAGDYISGLPSGFAHGAFVALDTDVSVGKKDSDLGFRWTLSTELDGLAASAGDPSEAYALFSLTYKTGKNVSLIPGFRLGITPFTPRFGAFFSIKVTGRMKALNRRTRIG